MGGVVASLTEFDLRLLLETGRFWIERGFAPSTRDIAGKHSNSAIWYSARKMQRWGLVAFDKGVTRSLRLTPRGWRQIGTSPPCCRPKDEHGAGVDKSPVEA